MATQLNIKDPETVRLVRDVAARTGRTVTATVREAVEKERLARETEIQERVRRANEIIDEVRKGMTADARAIGSWNAMESLYDDGEPDGFAR